MIGRASIKGSKSNVAMNAWLPHKPIIPVSGRGWSSWIGWVDPMTHLNKTGWSVTPVVNFLTTLAKGLIGHAFSVCIRTENQNQVSFYPFVLHEISILIELTLDDTCIII